MRRAARVSNGCFVLGLLALLIGVVTGRTVVIGVGAALLALAIVLAFVHASGRSRRRREKSS